MLSAEPALDEGYDNIEAAVTESRGHPFADRAVPRHTSDFVEIVFAILGVAAKPDRGPD